MYQGTITGTTGNSFQLIGEHGPKPTESPKGLIVTHAVQTKQGWLGQVFVDKTIVFESTTPHNSSENALDEANRKVVATVSALFTGSEA